MSQNPFLDLMAAHPQSSSDYWGWAYVTSTNPLHVRLEGETAPLLARAQNLAGPLAVGQKVWVQITSARIIVHGGQGAMVPWELVDGEAGRRVAIGTLGAGSEGEPSLALRRRYAGQDREAHMYVSAATADKLGEVGIQLRADGVITSRLYIDGRGQVTMQTYAGSSAPAAARPLPFAMAAGMVAIAGGSGTTTSTAVTFPAGRFTEVPVITMTPHTGAPEAISGWGHSGQTSGGFTAYMRRSNAVTTNFHWLAVQMTPTASTG
ncbi:hypothetical protein EDD28_0078 [Salana multivorans]|uniref:Uncharacterized protein n=1 Tax=Salana multivorans TaxID=120377 RepID=A0A3N2D6Z3_9MICO|nr:hypothetical protein [Salana multivorans]ROR95522.1 hypothetical protein EDD28_0078 [Salana multivorans]